ncbi:uncharacterized protein LOC143063331 isoform X4 [Mytilus galloprovincialis]|uniref:uncharacterized protein LOC143063331 isoform X4 n=1 Tax=Mytilus galloprovincialis TaxID=29158 RepID=UPI003F7CA0A7
MNRRLMKKVVNCCIVPLFVLIIPTLTQIPPGVPMISGPQVIIMDDKVTLTCTVSSGKPDPSVRWLRDDTVIDETYTIVGGITTNNYTFTASANEQFAVFECQSENGLLQNPLSRTIFVEVYKTPRTPVLTGPTEMISGTPTTWTCLSDGGYPVQTLSMRVGNSAFSTELDTKTAFDRVSQTYTVTGTLSWAPTTANDGQTLYCDVTHPETIGPNNPQTVSLPLTVKSPLDVNAPQTQYNPTTGETISLTCVITSGTATQVRWYKNNKLVIMAANLRLSGGNANTPSLTITQVQLTDAGSYICEATDGSATRNTTTITVSPKATPQPPTLTGPSTVTPGTPYTWTCVSLGGFPEQTMSIRVDNSVFTNEATFKSEYDDSTKAFRVTGTLVWSPDTSYNGQKLYCEVTHTETLGPNNPQTTSLSLTVQSTPQTPELTGPASVISGTSHTWTCISSGGYPEQTMSIRVGNSVFGNEVTFNIVYDESSKTYRVTGTLVWSPTTTYNGETLYCDVLHPDTLGNSPQTVSLPLTVQATPNTPVLTGPASVTAGTSNTWTCVSSGGYPEQTMSIRVGSSVFGNEVTFNTVYDESSKTYRVTGTLVWSPTTTYNGETLYCDVLHPDTLGNSPQTVSLSLTVQATPNTPVLTGPASVTAGTSNTWTCVSSGGYPEQTMSIRVGNSVFGNEVTFNTVYDESSKTYRVTGTLVWSPATTYNGETLYCDVLHPDTLGNSPQTVSLSLTVQATPQTPVLTGPASVTARTSNTWTCVSSGGYPEQTMSIRVGSSVFGNEVTFNTVYDESSKTYRVTGTLLWSPTTTYNGETLYCDVLHPDTLGNSPQTVSLSLTVQATPQPPTLTGPTTVSPRTSRVAYRTPETWTCVSLGGFPEQTMSIRLENSVFTTEVTTKSEYDQTLKTYKVTGTLVWSPDTSNNGQSLYCDVTHPETLGPNNPQTVSLQLTVQATPQTPELTGPVSVISGTSHTWTCVSSGGFPEQTLSIRVGNSVFGNRVTFNTVYDEISKTYRVTGTLVWSPTTTYNRETLYCDVSHPDTLGNSPQTVSLPLTVQAIPQPPTLTGPTTATSGTPETWICISMGGNPEQKMSMRIGNTLSPNELTTSSEFDQNSKTYKVTGTLVWSPKTSNNGEIVYCDVTHETLGNSPQTVSLPLTVKTTPETPLLTGPTTMLSGTSNTWTCLSLGGNPKQTMSMRIGTTLLNSQVTISSEYDEKSKLNRVTGTLVWSPESKNNGETLSCDVLHPDTLGQSPQTVSLTLTVNSTPTKPTLTGPTKITTGVQKSWTCTSRGAFPEQSMTIRIGNSVFGNEVTVNSVYDDNSKTYEVTGTLLWTPSTSSDREVLYCDVFHPETLGSNNPQTTNLSLTIKDALTIIAPKTLYDPFTEDAVTLDCVITSGTPTEIKWYRNSDRIFVSVDPRLSGGNTDNPALTISEIEMADGGSYVCEATNEFSTVDTNTISLSPIEKPATEHYIITKILNGYNKLVRPTDSTVNVTHFLIPMELVHFEAGKLLLESMQCMSWIDPRLSWNRGQNRVSLPSSEIWIPDIVLLGQKYEPDFETKVIVTQDGNVVYCPQGQITSTTCQEKAEVYECDFRFLSWSYDKVMLDIRLPATQSIDSHIDMSVFMQHEKYEVVSRCATREEVRYPCREGTYPELKYSLVLSRRRTFCRDYNQSPTCN